MGRVWLVCFVTVMGWTLILAGMGFDLPDLNIPCPNDCVQANGGVQR